MPLLCPPAVGHTRQFGDDWALKMTTEVLLDNLWFANGVAIVKDESYVLVCETFMARIVRLWLTGPKKGSQDVFSSGFPGYCDGISFSDDGTVVYAAIPSPAPPVFAVLKAVPLAISTFLRNVVLSLPLWLRRKAIKPVPTGCILEINASSGEVTTAYNDANGEYISFITAVTSHQGSLFLGGLHNPFVGVFKP
jgi:hypothetical protein